MAQGDGVTDLWKGVRGRHKVRDRLGATGEPGVWEMRRNGMLRRTLQARGRLRGGGGREIPRREEVGARSVGSKDGYETPF